MITRCAECNAEISDKAVACPKCGCPAPGAAALTPAVSYPWLWGFEWRTKAEIAGWPIVHVAVGRSKKTGKLLIAKGIIAIGQFGMGVITIAQFGIGFLFALGQFCAGFFAVAQFACGHTVIGQFAAGYYVLAQLGFGAHVWSVTQKDPQVWEYFRQLGRLISG